MYFNSLSFVICRIFRKLWNKKIMVDEYWIFSGKEDFFKIEFVNCIWVVKNFSVWYIYKVILYWVEK